ncbi:MULTISPECIES: hypothetical protein [unclassified Streptomyces]|uniref:hypothetical protein n=1 Tax=unclassified Streptomyces TaxID=2593676 RepID=UPI000369E346|nr:MULTISPECIES: hypothetical protein [unclassified Streptomyces]
MVKRQRKKSRDKARSERTGASRASAATGNVHRHEPMPDMTILEGTPYAAGQRLNLDFAARLVAACWAKCGPCQESIARKVVERHRPTLAALAGAVYGLELNEPVARSPHVSATTRSWAPLARAAAKSSDGTAAYAAVEQMTAEEAADLLEDALDHWALGGASTDEITDMIKKVMPSGPPPRTGGPQQDSDADPLDAFRQAGVDVFTLDDLDLDIDVDPYHLAPNYGVMPMQTIGADGCEMPMLLLYPETEDAGIEDLKARTGWKGWDLRRMPPMDPNWRLRARIADHALEGLVHVGPDGWDDLELWRAAESVSLRGPWWELLDRVQHVLVAGPVKDPDSPGAVEAAAAAGELMAVVARVSFS